MELFTALGRIAVKNSLNTLPESAMTSHEACYRSSLRKMRMKSRFLKVGCDIASIESENAAPSYGERRLRKSLDGAGPSHVRYVISISRTLTEFAGKALLNVTTLDR